MHVTPESPLTAVNRRFVKEYLVHQWLDFKKNINKPINMSLLEEAALTRGLSMQKIGTQRFYFSGDQCVGATRGIRLPMNGIQVSDITSSKQTTRYLLKRAGVPTPAGQSFPADDLDSARAHFNDLPAGRYVVKPTLGRQGLGVTTGVMSSTDLDQA